jgi:hypothetical protein
VDSSAIQWGLMMRFLVALLLSLFALSPNKASALIVTNGDIVYVSGPFGPDPLDPVAVLTATILVYANSNGSFPYPEVQAGWHAAASVGDVATLSTCGYNIPGDCRIFGLDQTTALFGIFHPTSLLISTSFVPFIFDPNNILPPGTSITGTTYVDLELIGEGDGFTISTAVPEPSTWAMMLIGFVAIGFLAKRLNKQADSEKYA